MRKQGRRPNVPSRSRMVKATEARSSERHRLTYAGKADAEAVIFDAASRLTPVDISSFGGELATGIRAAMLTSLQRRSTLRQPLLGPGQISTGSPVFSIVSIAAFRPTEGARWNGMAEHSISIQRLRWVSLFQRSWR